MRSCNPTLASSPAFRCGYVALFVNDCFISVLSCPDTPPLEVRRRGGEWRDNVLYCRRTIKDRTTLPVFDVTSSCISTVRVSSYDRSPRITLGHASLRADGRRPRPYLLPISVTLGEERCDLPSTLRLFLCSRTLHTRAHLATDGHSCVSFPLLSLSSTCQPPPRIHHPVHSQWTLSTADHKNCRSACRGSIVPVFQKTAQQGAFSYKGTMTLPLYRPPLRVVVDC